MWVRDDAMMLWDPEGRAPWPGEAGKRVFTTVGKPAWQRWLAHQTMLINENRLSPLNPEHRGFCWMV